MHVRLATVVPLTVFGAGAYEHNVHAADEYVRRAAQRGAQLVCLPESYPGEWREPVRRVPVEELSGIARRHAVHLIGGFAEPVEGSTSRCYNTLALFDPGGNEVGRYRRCVPGHAPWAYRGGDYWDFDWVPADDVPVFETALGRIGMIVCSEIYSPELPRILALKGAEIILMPAGLTGPQRHPGGHGGALYETWRTLVWARAIENLAYTAMCANLPSKDSKSIAMVCSPEDVLLEEHMEGVYVVDLDLDRIRLLRKESDRIVREESPWRTKPGVLRDWRRDEVLRANPVLGGADQQQDGPARHASLHA